jgi:hypothetical protein
MSKSGWKKVRVVVELSVQGNYTDTDFNRDLNSLFNGNPLVDAGRQLPRLRDVPCGQIRVASFNRIQAASRIKHPTHEQFAKLRQLITELRTRVSQLESDTNPHNP